MGDHEMLHGKEDLKNTTQKPWSSSLSMRQNPLEDDLTLRVPTPEFLIHQVCCKAPEFILLLSPQPRLTSLVRGRVFGEPLPK